MRGIESRAIYFHIFLSEKWWAGDISGVVDKVSVAPIEV
jgi:hypothetical protein